MVWGLWKGEGDKGMVNRILPQEDGDRSLGHIEEVKKSLGEKRLFLDQCFVCVRVHTCAHLNL